MTNMTDVFYPMSFMTGTLKTRTLWFRLTFVSIVTPSSRGI